MKKSRRCWWCGEDPLYVKYHDQVWGRPQRDPLILFEKLCLDGQQAGLSWITILRKQQSYHEAYSGFDPQQIIHYDDQKVEQLLQNPGIVRNRLKVQSVIKNARAYLNLQQQGIDFSDFLWQFVGNTSIQNRWQTKEQVPVSTPQSENMSRALKKAGFSFVGPTICYAFMQAVGMINDHLQDCPQWQSCYEERL